MTYMLLTAAHPFDDNGSASDAQIRANIFFSEPSFDKYWSSSESARTFVLMLLRKDPHRRLTIEQLLQHPWLRQFDSAGRFGDDGAKATSRELANANASAEGAGAPEREAALVTQLGLLRGTT